MKKILLVIFGPTDGTEIIRLAYQLKKSGEFIPVVFFHGSYATLSDRLDYSLLDQIECHDARGVITSSIFSSRSPSVQPDEVFPGNKVTVSRQILDRLPLKMKIALRGIVYAVYRPVSSLRSKLYRLWHHLLRLSIIGSILSLKSQLREMTCLLKDITPDILILPLESIGHYSATFAKAAYDRDIPCVIIPYTVPVNVSEIAERWYYEASYWISGPLKRLLRRFYPEWVLEYKGRELLRLLPSQMFALHWLDMCPAEPWKAGGLKYANAIAVENEIMRDYYLREGFSEATLFVTGALVDDILAENRKHTSELRCRLYEELGFDHDLPMILSALPPDFTSREVCEFRTFDELVEFWVTSLSGLKDYNIVVRLHPSLSYDDMKYIEKWGVRISRNDTASLVPLCKIFVCSVSATIRWAITCGIPVINYDLFKFRYTDYDDAGGVIKMEEREAFTRELETLAHDPSYYQEIANRQQNCMHRWGNLDGKTTELMWNLFDQVIKRSDHVRV